jgi:glycosyltransferase involved in cell wall biosynthesis
MRERGADWHFLWAGPGEMRSEIAALCSELNATNFFLLPATDDVSAIYRILSGLIITSTFEGLPVVMLEALALGVPILSTPVGAIEEVLTAYGCGRISGPPGDVDALEREFLAFVDALPALREAAVMRRGDFADQFSAERMARQYDESWTRAMAEFQPHV